MSRGEPLLGESAQVRRNQHGLSFASVLIALVAFSFGVFFGSYWPTKSVMDTTLESTIVLAENNDAVNASAVESIVVYRQTAPMLTGIAGTNSADEQGVALYFLENFFDGTMQASCGSGTLDDVHQTLCDSGKFEAPAGISILNKYEIEVLSPTWNVYRACNLLG